MLEQLNLRPSERRLLVVVGLVLFVVVNVWMVWPHFSDLQRVQQRRAKALKTLAERNAAIDQLPAFEKRVAELEAAGAGIQGADRAIELQRTIENEAAESGFNITGYLRQNTTTNDFFLEQSQTITSLSGEAELVRFLHNLGSGNSTIRVRDLNLRPDPPRHRLVGSIELVASYKRKTPARRPSSRASVRQPNTEK